MGSTESYLARAPPVGGVLLPIMDGICADPEFDYEQPPFLGDEAWEEFEEAVHDAVERMWKTRCEIVGLFVSVGLTFLVSFLVAAYAAMNGKDLDSYRLDDVSDEKKVLAEIVLMPILGAGTILPRMYMLRTNRECDKEIRLACRRLESRCDGNLRVEYRTMHTDFCRRKGTYPFRAIALTPIVRATPAPAPAATLGLFGFTSPFKAS
mmetsp:Transcript_88698/g.255774  ORF Transcript_88698/g.255774 Transcript_88698/m.255774 type:complete len:208 (+) Transcript_88698:104-727(+)